LLIVDAAWIVLAVAVSVLTLGAGVRTVLAVASLRRLRRDLRAIEGAEKFEAVNLTTVIKRYVPARHQTNVAREEMVIAKQAIAARRPPLKRIAVVCGMVFVCGIAAILFMAPRRLGAIATTMLTRQPRANIAVLDIQGVWGWRADSLESCSENPQTIQVSPDQKTLTLRYAKPYNQATRTTGTITEVTFEVVSVKPNKLVLLRTDPGAFALGKPVPIDVLFLDKNTMSWSPSNSATMSSGAIERCAPARQ
jgi:hypothetical protein